MALKPSGRCAKHGGLHSGRPIKHGKYSKYMKGRWKEVYRDFVNDPDLPELYDEVALLRCALVDLLDMIQRERGDVKKGTIDLISKVVDKIGVTLVRISSIKTNFMTMESLVVVMQMIADVLAANLKNCPKCGINLRPLREKIYGSLNDVRVPDMAVQNNRKLLKGTETRPAPIMSAG